MAPKKSQQQQPSKGVVSPDQTLKAARALLAHIRKEAKQKAAASEKKNIFDEGDGSAFLNEEPIIITISTKHIIHESKRLKPHKIAIPHSLHDNENTRICLITADPQASYSSIFSSSDFPQDLAKRISLVCGYSKFRSKYRQYESLRKLYQDYDVFLADDRIVNFLPKVMGKVFYRNTTKRPIPVVLSRKSEDGTPEEEPRFKVGDETKNVGVASDIAAEIQSALDATLFHADPSCGTSIRLGFADSEPEHISENAIAVIEKMVKDHIPHGWNNVRGIYIKGLSTIALPIYVADELWLDQSDVVESHEDPVVEATTPGSKRKNNEKDGREVATKKQATAKKAEKDTKADALNEEIAARKKLLQKQKAAASKAIEA